MPSYFHFSTGFRLFIDAVALTLTIMSLFWPSVAVRPMLIPVSVPGPVKDGTARYSRSVYGVPTAPPPKKSSSVVTVV
jgi:hypothetical protein